MVESEEVFRMGNDGREVLMIWTVRTGVLCNNEMGEITFGNVYRF